MYPSSKQDQASLKNNQSNIRYMVSKFPKQPAPYMHNMSQKQHIKTIISLWKLKIRNFLRKKVISILHKIFSRFFFNFPKNPIAAVFLNLSLILGKLIVLIDQYLSLCARGKNESWCNKSVFFQWCQVYCTILYFQQCQAIQSYHN